MKKGREVRNLPVISVKTGVLLGYIRDLKVNRHQQLEGFFLETPAREKFFLPLVQVTNIGPDAVLAAGEPARVSHRQEELAYDSGSSGAWVMTDSGRSLGTVLDVVIEEKNGSIVGYEVSDGYLKDLILGRKTIPAAEILTYGSDAMIVAESNETQEEEI